MRYCLGAAIDSVLWQTRRDLEGIVVDDGSAECNLTRALPMPKTADPWSLTSLCIRSTPKVMNHGRDITFQMAEVAVFRRMFVDDPTGRAEP